MENDMQDYVTDFWDTFSEEEKDDIWAEGFWPPLQLPSR